MQDLEADPWSYLQAPEFKVTNSDWAREIAVEKDYHRVRTGPSSRQDIEAWMHEWTRTLLKAKSIGLAETINDQRVYRDFILAIWDYAPILAQICHFSMDEEADYSIALTRIEERFLRHIRYSDAKSTVSHSTFATSKGKAVEPKACLCGVKHWFSECDYLRADRPGRPQNFNPDPSIQRRVDEQLNDSKTRDKVNRSLDRTRKYESKDDGSKNNKFENNKKSNESKENTSNISSETPIRSRSPSLDIGSVSVAKNDALQSSWILDRGSDYHVCNRTMKDRFVKEVEVHEGLVAGLGYNQIDAYGRVTVNIKTPGGKDGVVAITDVAYIPDFPVNILSSGKLEKKGVYFDQKGRLLRDDKRPIIQVKEIDGFFVLEDNTES